MTDRELLKQTLDALELHATHHECGCVYLDPAITALREALAESALERMAENARELGLDYEQPAQEPSGRVVSASCNHAVIEWSKQTSTKGGGDPKNAWSWPIGGKVVYLTQS